jgi:hypothetical protein
MKGFNTIILVKVMTRLVQSRPRIDEVEIDQCPGPPFVDKFPYESYVKTSYILFIFEFDYLRSIVVYSFKWPMLVNVMTTLVQKDRNEMPSWLQRFTFCHSASCLVAEAPSREKVAYTWA